MTNHLRELHRLHEEYVAPSKSSMVGEAPTKEDSHEKRVIGQKKSLNVPRVVLPCEIDESYLQNGVLVEVEGADSWMRNTEKTCLQWCRLSSV